MSDDYLPQAGSLPARVVAYLHSLPIGTEIGTGQIAEALDVSVVLASTATETPLKHGLIVCDNVGHRRWWKRGPTQVPDEFIAAHPPKRHVETRQRPAVEPMSATPGRTESNIEPLAPGDDMPPAMLARDALLRPRTVVMRDDAPTPPEPEARKARAPARTAVDLRFGIFSDGSFTMERGGRVETFTYDETRVLMRFLTRTLLPNMDAAQ